MKFLTFSAMLLFDYRHLLSILPLFPLEIKTIAGSCNLQHF